ncbi:hypothetical protein [Actinomadura sp. WMMB 499]|uniref:hypothetical protein n=1 Tax=Actinomadura sp. WMMB 499 TaxID=1219491 RepID=UPI0020C764FE|nr:hypothetical protein [Actinomadura sp. WMMB 499]
MTRVIRMPSEAELPRGPRRDFVEELRRYYRAAGRPPLRKVSKRIEERTDLNATTASPETIRRMLRGAVVPTDWNRVNAVFQVFCELGSIAPNASRWIDAYDTDETNQDCLQRLWDEALEQGFVPARSEDPWASGGGFGGGGFSDNPPF